MRTPATPLRNWTLFLLLLLLCSVSASAGPAEAANGTTTTTTTTVATAHEGATQQSTPTSASPSSKYTSTESTCAYRTINYITHTLPQQCAKTSWSAPGEAVAATATGAEEGRIAGLLSATPAPGNRSESHTSVENGATAASTTSDAGTTSTAEPELDLEADSPFDNANFLSFEEWKKRNLAAVGQSPENVGQGRAGGTNQPARRRPVNVNALDSLGDEGEISIDFSGFGAPGDDGNVADSIQHGKQKQQSAGATKATNDGDGKVAAPSSWALSKDAGKTCKERFNFASFDCAATVLKTNKQAKSSTAVLVENKDSYMLNICSAKNKFLIVELCDDILVDTIVLANYEFFSSMFRHFRVSVSDRYPVKLEKWRTLGTFEARNSRDVQPFLITEPQIWARYLRVEFLTQYGNEYYCPLSVLRVHGTTMMEQFRQEEEEARGIEDDEDLEAEGVDVKKPAADSGPLSPEEIPIEAAKVVGTDDANEDVAVDASLGSSAGSSSSPTVTAEPVDEQLHSQPEPESPTTSPQSLANAYGAGSDNITAYGEPYFYDPVPQRPTEGAPHAEKPSSGPSAISPSDSSSRVDTATAPTDNPTAPSPSTPVPKASSNTTTPQPRSSTTQPSAPTPSTQESFFKSIHKRLQYLEANSTLSLQYIEEQSRALRDAFIAVEKRQLAKTEKFLDHLNSTVIAR
ncbi:hypothetical protein ACET3X_008749 [Alternaria dauci]|uniref:SUN domain-containing protein n=1 Tax=Alternaria dauci TaxID=48095 RepID=A0ABR3UC60_9PLEO